MFWILGAVSAIAMLLTAGMRNKSFNVGAGLTWFLLMTWASFLFLPTLSFFHVDIYLILLVSMATGAAVRFFAYDGSYNKDESVVYHYFTGWKVFLPALGLFLGLLFFTSSAVLHNDDYRNLLNVAEVEEFDPESVLLDQTQARFVDQALSSRAASELLGKEIGLGSRYDIGTMRIQTVDGKLYWVGPFQHKSWTRWLNNGSAPGYLMVNSNNYDDARMVTEKYEINYGTDGFYFDNHVPRYLYKNGYASVGLEDFTMEIRDDGQPFWVVSKIKKSVGFGGVTIDAVVTVNASNGDIQEYPVSKAPSWIDRIQPDSMVADRIEDWGRFISNWWNAYFIGTDVIVPTPGTLLVYTKDGRAMWYTGVQSDESGNTTKDGTMGFFMVDSRSGEATFYRRSGITESVAMTAMEGRVQEYGYKATNPIPYNVNGRSTFISILKDDNGNAQMIGLVAYDNRNLVAVGNTLQSAVRSYLTVLSANAGDNSVNEGIEQITITGTVDRLGFQSLNGQSQLFFTFAEPEYEDKIFSASSETALGTVLTQTGDQVKITVMSLDHPEISVTEFTNLSM